MKRACVTAVITAAAVTGSIVNSPATWAAGSACPTSWTARDLADYIQYSEDQGEDEFWVSIGQEWPQIGVAIFNATDANADGLICTKKFPLTGLGKPSFYDSRRDNTTSAG